MMNMSPLLQQMSLGLALQGGQPQQLAQAPAMQPQGQAPMNAPMPQARPQMPQAPQTPQALPGAVAGPGAGADPNAAQAAMPGLSPLAQAAAAVNPIQQQQQRMPPPGLPNLGGKLDSGIMSLLAQMLQGGQAPNIPTLGNLIGGR